MTRAIVILLALSAHSVAAQGPLSGAWQISFPRSVRVRNGVATTEQATGVLTFTSEGDSLIGLLVPDAPANGPARPPLRLAGVEASGQTTLISHSKATIVVNGEQHEATVTMIWKLRASGENLEGTLERQIEGEEEHGTGAQPVTGKRRVG